MTNHCPPFISTWVDDHPTMVVKNEYVDRLVRLYDKAAIMVDSMHSDWDPRYTVQQLKITGHNLVVERDVELILVFWPVPNKYILDKMFDDLDRFVGESGAYAVEPDVEGLMLGRVAREMGWNIRDAKKYLLELLFRLKEKHHCRIDMTTHASHPEAFERTAILSLSEVVDMIFWQVYATVHDWRGRFVPFRSRYGPYGRKVDIDRLAALSLKYDKKISFGMAEWDQAWPDIFIEDFEEVPLVEVPLNIMHEQYMIHDPFEIRNWSSGRTIGRFRNNGHNPNIAHWRERITTRIREEREQFLLERRNNLVNVGPT